MPPPLELIPAAFLVVFDGLTERAKADAGEGEVFPMVYFLFSGDPDIDEALRVGREKWNLTTLLSHRNEPREDSLPVNILGTPMFLPDDALLDMLARNTDSTLPDDKLIKEIVLNLAMMTAQVRATGVKFEPAKSALDAFGNLVGLDRKDFATYLLRLMTRDLKPAGVVQIMESWRWSPPRYSDDAVCEALQKENREKYGPSYSKWPGSARALSIYLETPAAHAYRSIDVLCDDPNGPATGFGEPINLPPAAKVDGSGIDGRFLRLFDPVRAPWEGRIKMKAEK